MVVWLVKLRDIFQNNMVTHLYNMAKELTSTIIVIISYLWYVYTFFIL